MSESLARSCVEVARKHPDLRGALDFALDAINMLERRIEALEARRQVVEPLPSPDRRHVLAAREKLVRGEYRDLTPDEEQRLWQHGEPPMGQD